MRAFSNNIEQNFPLSFRSRELFYSTPVLLQPLFLTNTNAHADDDITRYDLEVDDWHKIEMFS